VCEAVNTPVKLKFEIIGDKFDGFAEENNEGTLNRILPLEVSTLPLVGAYLTFAF
jgi:hypothetical protein